MAYNIDLQNWLLKHSENLFVVGSSSVIFIYFDKKNIKLSKFLCFINWVVSCIVVALSLFISIKLNFHTWKYIIAISSPFIIRPLVSAILKNINPILDLIIKLLTKKLKKWLE